jgi:prepilin-type N-terminal cleavage/methylation domain-containing protein
MVNPRSQKMSRCVCCYGGHQKGYQKGFTLIEIMVVVFIFATLSLIAVVAINQADERRYSNNAEKLLIWLNQLSEFSTLQGSAYGIVTESETDKKAKSTSRLSSARLGSASMPVRLRAAVYYRNRWLAVTFPEPFELQQGSTIDWLMDNSAEEPMFYQQAAQRTREEILEGKQDTTDDEDDLLQPPLAFLPDGYVEPEGDIVLSYEGYDRRFLFAWDDERSRMVMRSEN